MMVVTTNLAVWDPAPPLFEGLERVRELGFRGVTTGISLAMDDEALRRTLGAYEPFDCVAIHAPFGDTNPLSADPDERAAKWTQYEASIEASASVGAESVTFHPGDPAPELGAPEGDSLMAELMRKLDRAADKHGIWACWETGTGYFNPNDRFELIRELGLRKTGICLDTGHVVRVWRTCDAPTEVRTFTDFFGRFGDLVKSAHIHDWQDEITGPHGWNDHHVVGQGIIDWREVFEGFASTGYSGELCMEYHPLVVTSDEILVRSAEDIRNRIRKAGGEVI